MDNCVIAFASVMILILSLLLLSALIQQKDKLAQHVEPFYNSFKSSLKDMKTKHQIGKPPGVLGLVTKKSCDSNKNQLIQSNVAFRSHRSGKDECTNVNEVWPVQ